MDLTLAVHASMSLPIDDLSSVGSARRIAIAQANSLGLTETQIGRVALVVTEAASNIVYHGGGGELLLRAREPHTTGAWLEMVALDKGKGMANIAHHMRDGYSSRGSRGVGLGAMARLADFFEIFSMPGKGTVILACFGADARAWQKTGLLEWGVMCVAALHETLCGDALAVRQHGRNAAVLVVDGLGHGQPACEAATKATAVFAQETRTDPEVTLRAMDAGLRKTRGAAAAVADIDWQRNELRFAGVGNIAGVLSRQGTRNRHLVSHVGTLGAELHDVQEFSHEWQADDLLIMHSDGIAPLWDLEEYSGLRGKTPTLIASILYRDFVRRRDDAVVFIGRKRVAADRSEEGTG